MLKRSSSRTAVPAILVALALASPVAVPAQESKARTSEKSGTSKSSAGSTERSSSKSTSDSGTKSEKSKSEPSKSTSKDEEASAASKSGTTDNKSRQNPAADAPINPEAFDAQMLSKLVFDLTNVERRRAGLPAFTTNRYLDASAEAHSRDMAGRSYFNHKSKGILRRTDPRTRVEAVGYKPNMVAENLAMIPTFNSQRIQTVPGRGNQVIDVDYNSYNRLAAYAVKQWMESPGHRENIMNRSLTELGVGVAIGMKDNVPYVYLTQNFGG